jgi:two-component system LytT family response regulator
VSAALRVVVADDEEPARQLLAELLGRLPGVEVVAACANGLEAVRAAAEKKPDAVFLDIEMPGLDGFEALSLLDPTVAVVFVTAYDQYAVRAFEVEAVDYVLKPYRPERLAGALARARERAARQARPDPARLAAAVRPAGRHAARLAVREGADVLILPVARVDYVEARDDAVAIRAEGKTYLKSQTLASVEATLDPARFVRVHRSYVVNLDRLRRLERYAKNSHAAVLADGARIPISRDGYARLRALVGEDGSG